MEKPRAVKNNYRFFPNYRLGELFFVDAADNCFATCAKKTSQSWFWLFLFQDRDTTKNGIKYTVQLLYANGELYGSHTVKHIIVPAKKNQGET